ncbi:MAG: hypothetical protein M1817_003189 [Caeruleum heppii]|nr:MAG: hypothetical protein M1817_003189 [Caeruleum heppii]
MALAPRPDKLRPLPNLPDELLMHILTFLDVPELLSVSRTSHHLRRLALDPILHSHRRHLAFFTLRHRLHHRPSPSTLSPPNRNVLLSTNDLRARHLSRSIIAIRLKRHLSSRPSPAAILRRGDILPRECWSVEKSTGEAIYGGGVAPGIVEARRRVERERVRDFLRGWWAKTGGGERGREVAEQRGWVRQHAADGSRDGPGLGKREGAVRSLALRFARRANRAAGGESSTSRWGPFSGRERKRRDPPRANVLGLRRFWERVGREGLVK